MSGRTACHYTSHQSRISEGKCPFIRLELCKRHHVNRIPRATFEESSVRTFAGAQFAPDAKQGIDNNTPKRRMVLVRGPVHAIGDRTIIDTGGDPEQPVQDSLMTARMCGLRLRCVVVPVEIGSYLTTVPALNSSMLEPNKPNQSSTYEGYELIFLPTRLNLSIILHEWDSKCSSYP